MKGIFWDYKGEVDANGNACGIGKALSPKGCKLKGTFYDDTCHGLRKIQFRLC